MEAVVAVIRRSKRKNYIFLIKLIQGCFGGKKTNLGTF